LRRRRRRQHIITARRIMYRYMTKYYNI